MPTAPPTPPSAFPRGASLLASMASALLVLWMSGALGKSALLLGAGSGGLPASLWHDAFAAGALLNGEDLSFTDAIAFPAGIRPAGVAGSTVVACFAAPFVWIFGYPAFWTPFVFAALVCNGLAAAWGAAALGAGRLGSAVAAVAFTLSPAALASLAEGRQAEFCAAGLAVAAASGLRLGDKPRNFAPPFVVATLLTWFVWWPDAVVAAALAAGSTAVRAFRSSGRERAWWALGSGAIITATGIGTLLMHEPNSPNWHPWGTLPDLATADGLAIAHFWTATRHTLPLASLVGLAPDPGEVAVSIGCLLLVLLWLAANGARRGALPLLAATSALLATGRWLAPEWDVSNGWLPLPLAYLEALVPALSDTPHPERHWLPGTLALGWMAALLVHRATTAARALPLRIAVGVLGLALAAAPARLSGRLPVSGFVFEPPAWVGALGTGAGAVVHIPLGWSPIGAAWQPLHGHPIAGGPSEGALFSPRGTSRLEFVARPGLAALLGPENGLVSASTRDDLRIAGVGWVVVDLGVIAALDERDSVADRSWFLTDLAGQLELALGPSIYTDDDVRVYRVEAPRVEAPG